jgi:pyruvate/2-oxoglutarate dehydrogenase complex dihydrolipoamide dehydrogenase (E3) component
MTQRLEADICVIGAGSAGLSVAAGASQLGARTVLIESGKMGGDCLNYGCVPSKALLAAAHAAQSAREAGRFGLRLPEPVVDFAAVRDHVQGVIGSIAPHDSQERFEGLGVTVIRAPASFGGPDQLAAGDYAIHARRFVVATGSTPFVPPLPGLEKLAYLTNETVFDLEERPRHLLVLGGGPIGCELAQAFRRLGSEVTIVEMARLLPKDDPDAVAVVRSRLRAEDVRLIEGSKVRHAEAVSEGIKLLLEGKGGPDSVTGSHLLIAAGRRPNVAGLNLEGAGVAVGPQGIIVDHGLRTSNRRVFAIGDVIGGLQFTHAAGYHAGIVIRRALFRLPAKMNPGAIPWVTYTDPELAQTGETEASARQKGLDVAVTVSPFSGNDRARTERDTDGFVKVVSRRNGRILGATIVGAQAGELIQVWALAIAHGLKLNAMAGLVAPYPTRGEAGKRAAGEFYAPRLFSARTRGLIKFLQMFG